jgi:hypothetical protein
VTDGRLMSARLQERSEDMFASLLSQSAPLFPSLCCTAPTLPQDILGWQIIYWLKLEVLILIY